MCTARIIPYIIYGQEHFNPNRSFGRKWRLFVTSYCLLFFIRHLCSLFLAQNSPLLFAKTTSGICSPKNQNTISPNDRIGFNYSFRALFVDCIASECVLVSVFRRKRMSVSAG